VQLVQTTLERTRAITSTDFQNACVVVKAVSVAGVRSAFRDADSPRDVPCCRRSQKEK